MSINNEMPDVKPTANIIHDAHVGDTWFSVEMAGTTKDAYPCFYGYAYYVRPEGRKVVGLNWDEARNVTFIGGDELNVEERLFLTEAGFTLPAELRL